MTPAQLLERITPGPWVATEVPSIFNGTAWDVDAPDDEVAVWLEEANARAISLLPDLLRLHVAAEAYQAAQAEERRWECPSVEHGRAVIALAAAETAHKAALAALSDKMK